MTHKLVAAALALAVFGRANADELVLSTDKAVYEAGVGGSGRVSTSVLGNPNQEGLVLVSVANNLPNPVSFWPGIKVTQGTKIVLDTFGPFLIPLGSGQKMIVGEWDKKDERGKFVPAGTYTISGAILLEDGSTKYVSTTIALTPTGRIAGTSLFPLAVGNAWVYEREGGEVEFMQAPPSQMMKVTSIKNGWASVENLAFQSRSVRMTGGMTKPTLQTKTEKTVRDLFRFHGQKYQPYPFLAPDDVLQGILTVDMKDEDIVTTPAGTFTGCTRVTVVESMSGYDTSYDSFWFTPGIGLVQYSFLNWTGDSMRYSLSRATLKGSDGKTYTIGRN